MILDMEYIVSALKKYIDNHSGGGTSDYKKLSNLPTIAGIKIIDNVTLKQIGAATESDLNTIKKTTDTISAAVDQKEDKIKNYNITETTAAINAVYGSTYTCNTLTKMEITSISGGSENYESVCAIRFIAGANFAFSLANGVTVFKAEGVDLTNFVNGGRYEITIAKKGGENWLTCQLFT